MRKVIIIASCIVTVLLGIYAALAPGETLQARNTALTKCHELITRRMEQRDSLLERHLDIKSSLNYYLRAHHVDDEGYDMIADYNAWNDSIIAHLKAYDNICIKTSFRPLHHSNKPKPYYVVALGGYWGEDGWHKGLPPFRQGTIVDSTGVYQGSLNNDFLPDGHGVMMSSDGCYFEGEWASGERHGFGFRVHPFHDIQVGTWLKNRYKGERLRFTPERIYGIDISRHQHEKRGKRLPFDWRHLRIVDLGRHNQKNVQGDADYPVSFVYIKATEGTTITNRFFLSDYNAAHKYGYHVGAYHFYSTKSSAKEQAKHFLKTAHFNSGDFPPVFDVEPTDHQIEILGGADKLLSEMRVWLNEVEHHLGIRPILYVNQNFVERYLSKAPDLKKGYQIWIARYSEYQPGIRLCMWQLSSTGRVKGITGDVDINVFNGYADQWQEFLSEGVIP